MNRCRYSGCGELFEPKYRTTEICCSVEHAIAYAKESSPARLERQRKRAEAQERRDRRNEKVRFRRRRDWVKLAQAEFNLWVKERDRNEGCISCHMPATYQGQWHASHYRSVGAAPQLRFDPSNVHKSCAQCNSFKSGNVVEYRIRLVQKIGLAEVERLECDNAIHRHTVEELQGVIILYRSKLKELRRAAA